jgi:hypothetical protein
MISIVVLYQIDILHASPSIRAGGILRGFPTGLYLGFRLTCHHALIEAAIVPLDPPKSAIPLTKHLKKIADIFVHQITHSCMKQDRTTLLHLPLVSKSQFVQTNPQRTTGAMLSPSVIKLLIPPKYIVVTHVPYRWCC